MAVKPTSLVTLLSALDELNLESDGGKRDRIIERLIDDASELVESHCGRKFSRLSVVNEAVAGYHSSQHLLLERPPINDALITDISITASGSALPMGIGYDIHDREAGILFAVNGWPESVRFRGGASNDTVAGTNRKTLAVTYDGGYITEVQSADSDGTYAGQTVTLPGPVRRAVLETVVLWYRTQGKNPGMRSQRIGPAAETYGPGLRVMPRSVEMLLAGYCSDFGGAI
jgi:hypothetical protein